MSLSLRCFHIFVFYFTLSIRSSKGLSSRWPLGGSRDPWLLEMILQFSLPIGQDCREERSQSSRSLLLNDIFIHPWLKCKTPGRKHVPGSQGAEMDQRELLLSVKSNKSKIKNNNQKLPHCHHPSEPCPPSPPP